MSAAGQIVAARGHHASPPRRRRASPHRRRGSVAIVQKDIEPILPPPLAEGATHAMKSLLMSEYIPSLFAGCVGLYVGARGAAPGATLKEASSMAQLIRGTLDTFFGVVWEVSSAISGTCLLYTSPSPRDS